MTKNDFFTMLANWNNKERETWLAESHPETPNYREILFTMLANWNNKERETWLAEPYPETPGYREILFTYPFVDGKSYEIIIKEYGYCGGVRSSEVYLLDCGAILINIENEYMKPWESDGIISYDKLLEFITNIDNVDKESCHISYRG